ncbi:uncharacterized protein [Dermacentor andersoni]|uniref:uncharacterized protein n=1 Tax=Dermacentor andersoni TaxID=34620 RepID=UPI002415F29B|nr:uncharacterized protein LOC129387777 [Dermacentor andersoni]
MFCENSREGYYYDGKLKKCVATRDEQYFVCNNGPNRFDNDSECNTYCKQRHPPEPRCEEAPVFVPCEKKHLTVTWWFFDGTRCVEWDFSGGECPQIADTNFQYKTKRECDESCTKDPMHAVFYGCYSQGGGDACATEHIREPWFAFRHPNGTLDCHLADISTINEHRCVDEDRWFEHLEDCEATCMRSSSLAPEAPPPIIRRQRTSVNFTTGMHDAAKKALEANH